MAQRIHLHDQANFDFLQSTWEGANHFAAGRKSSTLSGGTPAAERCATRLSWAIDACFAFTSNHTSSVPDASLIQTTVVSPSLVNKPGVWNSAVRERTEDIYSVQSPAVNHCTHDFCHGVVNLRSRVIRQGSKRVVPAVILYAFRLWVGCCGDRTRSLDLLSRGWCATDLRVRVELDCGGTRVQIEVEMWQSFGGRDSDNRDEAEDAHFSDEPMIDEPFDINHPPVRDLEKVFKGGVEGECAGLWAPNQLRRRQSWIQLWNWHYDPIMSQLRRYGVI
ncbi:uncharacterized protein PV06_10046 [Exophiala oligosperma]|uniref:Uncharacterized protein n=1 Tax=Exophiala oligosperma TaxID=215243 RepID=A0A0D2BL51_9EURO|nr:uncharacterized protein PV06_10046 [Exophiala oligosperma]KIW38077.1 hypothetical protein PV06_10046 [Exophiala oligosperma]